MKEKHLIGIVASVMAILFGVIVFGLAVIWMLWQDIQRAAIPPPAVQWEKVHRK